jgi:hypothetical protein
MWNFILGFLFARATGISRVVRPVLILTLFGVLIAGLVYAFAVFHALAERSHDSHVHAHPSH